MEQFKHIPLAFLRFSEGEQTAGLAGPSSSHIGAPLGSFLLG